MAELAINRWESRDQEFPNQTSQSEGEVTPQRKSSCLAEEGGRGDKQVKRADAVFQTGQNK